MWLVMLGFTASGIWLLFSLMELKKAAWAADRDRKAPKARSDLSRRNTSGTLDCEMQIPARRMHEEMVEHYRNSLLLRQILRTIGTAGTGLPEKIVITHTGVTGEAGGVVRRFDFEENQEQCLGRLDVCFLPSEEAGLWEADYLPQPQVAMAEAINLLTQSEYRIIDFASRSVTCLPDGRLCVEYRSDYVEMRSQ